MLEPGKHAAFATHLGCRVYLYTYFLSRHTYVILFQGPLRRVNRHFWLKKLFLATRVFIGHTTSHTDFTWQQWYLISIKLSLTPRFVISRSIHITNCGASLAAPNTIDILLQHGDTYKSTMQPQVDRIKGASSTTILYSPLLF